MLHLKLNKRIMITIDKRKSCPNGGCVSYPIGTLRKIKMGDVNCKGCPCFKIGEDEKEVCTYE